jgi:hypothetical protein
MEGENQTIVGYASTFDQPYPVDMVTEIIDRSAFTRTLSEKPDVYALIGHDPSRILGRTKNGTLSLSIDERGLKCVITPVMTRDAEDTLKLIASGCIDAMSFGFKVVKQAFGYAEGKTTRRITDLELHEVSCVAFPANENATLSLRAREMVTQFQREKRYTPKDVQIEDDKRPTWVFQQESDELVLLYYPDGNKDGYVEKEIVLADSEKGIEEWYKEHGVAGKKDTVGFGSFIKDANYLQAKKGDVVKVSGADMGRPYIVRSIEHRKTYDEVVKSTKAETTKGVKVDYTVFGTAKGESKGKKLGVYPTSAKAEAMAEKFKAKGYADINIVAYENYSKGSKKVQQDAFDEAMGGRSAGAVETRADNSDVVKKLPQSIIHIKNEDGNIFAENIQTNDVIAVMTDDYDDEQEFYESQDIKDIKDVQGFADYLVGLGLVEKGDVVMSAGKKYVVRSTPATKLETRATPATEGQQALNVENLKAEANHAEKLVRIAKATLLRVQADRMEAIDRSMGELAHLNSLVRTAEDKVTEAENYAKETYSAFEKAEDKLRDMLRKGKKGNRSCNAKLLELRNRIASPIDRK